MKLTEKQKRFADYYIETGNATEAYKKAYNCKNDVTARTNANKNLQKPTIRQYIDELMASKDSIRIAKQDEVLEFLTNVLRGKVQEQFPLGLGMGEQRLVRKDLDGKDRIKAAELLGKRYAMWTDKQQVENITPTFVDDVPDED